MYFLHMTTIHNIKYIIDIKRFQERLSTKPYPESIVNSINMTEMLSYIYNNQFDKIVDFLTDRVKIL